MISLGNDETRPIFHLSAATWLYSDGGRVVSVVTSQRPRPAQPGAAPAEDARMAIERTGDKRIHVELTIRESQREELQLAWHEIAAGRRMRIDALNHEIAVITERGMSALRVIENAIRRNPTTGQARRLVWFLAAVYNGSEFPFDLTELRALDTELANACLDYLNYDRLGRREVHRHLSCGERELHRWIEDYGIAPRTAAT